LAPSVPHDATSAVSASIVQIAALRIRTKLPVAHRRWASRTGHRHATARHVPPYPRPGDARRPFDVSA
jgi:hypothetical protein